MSIDLGKLEGLLIGALSPSSSDQQQKDSVEGVRKMLNRLEKLTMWGDPDLMPVAAMSRNECVQHWREMLCAFTEVEEHIGAVKELFSEISPEREELIKGWAVRVKNFRGLLPEMLKQSGKNFMPMGEGIAIQQGRVMLRDPIMQHLLLAVFADHNPTFEDWQRPVSLEDWIAGKLPTGRPHAKEERVKTKETVVTRMTLFCVTQDPTLLTEFSCEVGKHHAAAIIRHKKTTRQGKEFLEVFDRMMGPEYKDKREAAKTEYYQAWKETASVGSTTRASSASAPTASSNASVASTAQQTSGGTEAATSVAGTLPITELILSREEFSKPLDQLTVGATGDASTRGTSGQERPAPTS